MNMQKRPKLNLKITPLELILNGVTLVLFIGSMVYLLFVWQSLPSEVPAHYNALGEVDRWGSKWEMLILPIIATVLWIGMTILEKYPHVYNYINLTEDNVRNQYLNVRLMVNVLKNIITLVFVYLNWKDVQVALDNEHGLSVWFMPIFLTLLFVPIVYFIIRSVRIKK